ncbi:MAG: MmgE/PrpD family protein [Hyphomicrobiales bacterium]|nr:MmgE/PrpD family protein [Hyphomicrobiales bacterium]
MQAHFDMDARRMSKFIDELTRAVANCDGGDGESRALIGRAIADTLAAAAAGFPEPVTRMALAAHGGGRVPTWSGETCDSAEAAVMIDAIAAHALDFDDVFLESAAHASAVILPVVLRLDGGHDPDDIVAAFGAGLIAARAVARRVGLGHYHKGWHGTGTIGAFAAAAAAGRLAGLDERRMRAAFALVASMSGGLKINFGTEAKPCQAGFAAAAGHRAARLAAAGIEGASDVFGPGGYAELYGAGDGKADLDESDFAPRPDRLSVKLYPCCYAAHRLIGVALSARDALGPVLADPDTAVRVTVPAASLEALRYDRPATGLQAKFSGPYALATALMKGPPTLANFADEVVAEGDLAAAMDRIEIVEDPSQPSGGDIEAGAVILDVFDSSGRLCGGFARRHIPGSPDDPPSRQALAAKIDGCLAVFARAYGGPPPAVKRAGAIPQARAWLDGD